ncbi:hypothetical protein [Paenibacillus rigui]|uniref:Heparinase n=1 Tax=Paenibacillus rigui TaxID=554312 RepID=A0A229UGL6_9BACL|nr:hypothetical protein [Paenibacillus rigui]OXM82533.1 hypothetical protein CF651_30405 [Paenibacillus rigui]
MEAVYERLVLLYDEVTESTLGKQVRTSGSKYAGGIMDDSLIPRPNHGGTPSVMACWACALVNPASKYYRDAAVLSALELAADFMLNRQHADGTISLGSTNFNSPPDTAFVVGGVTQIYKLLSSQDWPDVRPAAEKLRLFLERTIPAMLTGGCHTPNHRWVLTAALSLLYEIFGLPELLEAVRRNLRMMVYLVHPSGEIVTDYSGRQDFGHTYSMATYFLAYRLMAALDRDPLFAAMADYAGSFIQGTEAVNNNALLQLMVYPQQTDLSGLERASLPDRYVKAINREHPMEEHLDRIDSIGHHMKIEHSSMHLAFGAPVVRIREQDTSVTLMTRTPSFFSMRHGAVRLLGVKLSSAFSPGVVKFDSLVLEDGVYKLGITMEKGYTGPIPRQLLPEREGQASGSPWYLLAHQHRPVTHLQTHRLTAELTPGESEWSIKISSDEREDVATQLTFILGVEGTLSGEGVNQAEHSRYFLKSGKARYEAGGEAIEISSGAWEHGVPTLRNDDHPAGCRYVHVNLITPFERTFTVRLL